MIGLQLGAYTIEAELGLGGMGTVYRAKGPEGLFALKIIHPHVLATPGFFKRFPPKASHTVPGTFAARASRERTCATRERVARFADGAAGADKFLRQAVAHCVHGTTCRSCRN